jgi:hypothetical protein
LLLLLLLLLVVVGGERSLCWLLIDGNGLDQPRVIAIGGD